MNQDKALKVEGPLHVVCQCNWCKAHPEQNLSCKSVQARLAAAWGYVKAQPEQEPVAWVGLDLDGMVEAFHRVIEEHHSRKNPFHDPVNGDAMLALRELRGLIAYMKRNTTPPQRKPLDAETRNWIVATCPTPRHIIDTVEKMHGIKGEA